MDGRWPSSISFRNGFRQRSWPCGRNNPWRGAPGGISSGFAVNRQLGYERRGGRWTIGPCSRPTAASCIPAWMDDRPFRFTRVVREKSEIAHWRLQRRARARCACRWSSSRFWVCVGPARAPGRSRRQVKLAGLFSPSERTPRSGTRPAPFHKSDGIRRRAGPRHRRSHHRPHSTEPGFPVCEISSRLRLPGMGGLNWYAVFRPHPRAKGTIAQKNRPRGPPGVGSRHAVLRRSAGGRST